MFTIFGKRFAMRGNRNAATSRKLREIFSPQMGQINVLYTTEVNSVEMGKLILLIARRDSG